nr:uncharacterized protein LOC109746669 isoform X2 [Aegilops tauschii subsp. strangulata]
MSTSTTITPLLRPSPRRPGLLTSPWRSPHPRAPDYPPAPAPTCHLAVTSTDEREADEEFVVVTYNLVPVDDPRAPLHYEQSLIQVLGCFSGFSGINRACSPVRTITYSDHTLTLLTVQQ